jgi:hypothetical protein
MKNVHQTVKTTMSIVFAIKEMKTVSQTAKHTITTAFVTTEIPLPASPTTITSKVVVDATRIWIVVLASLDHSSRQLFGRLGATILSMVSCAGWLLFHLTSTPTTQDAAYTCVSVTLTPMTW